MINLHPIEPKDYPFALALFQNSLHQMKLAALAESRIEARVCTDGDRPQLCVVLYQNKVMIASVLPAMALAEALMPFLQEQLYENRMGGCGDAQIFWDGDGTQEALLMALGDKCPAFALREYWEMDGPTEARLVQPPDGYEVVLVSEALLQRGLAHTEQLREEMCSERVSVEAFLGQSFGVCAVRDGELAGWCLSEYNCSRGCEVGIETVEGHRRKGLAQAMVSAFAAEAARRGVPRIGWHCFRSNVPSRETARAAGLMRVLEYGELICCFDMAVQYAVNGNFADGLSQYEVASAWYSRACAAGDGPLWAYVRHAMALVSLGRQDEAFASLEAGVARGLDWWGWLDSEPRLAPLRQDGRWQGLMEG